MKTHSLVGAASIGFMFLLLLGIKAEAAELKVLSAIGMQLVMEDLGPKFAGKMGSGLVYCYLLAVVLLALNHGSSYQSRI